MTFPEHHHSHVIFDIIAWGAYLWLCLTMVKMAAEEAFRIRAALKDRK